MRAQVERFVARRWSVPAALLRVDVQPMRGGLESAVALASVSTAAPAPPVPSRFVVKALAPACRREAEVYALLWKHLDEPPLPEVLGAEVIGEHHFLYLEHVRQAAAWPWAAVGEAAAVCRALARLHDAAALPLSLLAWDYEADLARSAEATLRLAESARESTGARYWRRPGDLRRVVAALAAIRARLLSRETTLIHGDVHPGNVIVREGSVERPVTFIDWSRARAGSPLEDAASWLHSLGCWEPQARRRHDTLLRAYLDSRRTPRPLTPELRRDYWFACVGNGLSGAIRYHLAVLADGQAPGGLRYDSWRALREWQRVVRRAAALISTSPDRRR